MKTKEESIEEYLKSPIKVGDKVNYGNHYSGKVLKIYSDGIDVTSRYGFNKPHFLKFGEFKKCTIHIGINPFVEKPWDSALKMVNFSLDSILHSIGYGRERKKSLEPLYQELNWNPTINGVVYQRDFCWTLGQKQLLIDSIYQNINIGTIVVKKNTFKSVEEKVSKGEVGYFRDCVDGKQRLSTILDFVNNKFPDSNGTYFKDFSDSAINKFMNFSAIGYGELGENSTDEDVKSVFLGINFTGVPMSKEHIEFVKNIKL